MVDLSVVVVNYRTPELLERFLYSLDEYKPSVSFETIVMDVAPKKYPPSGAPYDTWSTYSDNVGYAAACNDGAALGQGEVIAFFNADTSFLDDKCIDQCMQYLEDHHEVGAVGPRQIDRNGRITHAGINNLSSPRGWRERDHGQYSFNDHCATISGSAYFTPRHIWNEMAECPQFREVAPKASGAFLPTPLYFEETYYSYHLRGHGYEVGYVGEAVMRHDWNQSPGSGTLKSGMAARAKRQCEFALEVHGLRLK